MADQLVIRGAREHNLKDISLDLPRDSLIVFTGLSGSGKSSLAFDTIFAEGQRRYVESLSAYARQFLGQMDKPDVDFIEGLSPAVSIDQKSTSKNPRSTVGTITEVYDYLRLLYARAGRPHCPTCGAPIERQTPQQIVDRILSLEEGQRFQVLAPVIRGRKGEYVELFKQLQAQGFSRARVNGETHTLDDPPKLDKQKKHTIEVVIDRLKVAGSAKRRLTDSVETALNLASGLVLIDFVDLPEKDPGRELRFSERMACPNEHPIDTDELEPRSFSFNSPFGACPECHGLGTRMEVDPELVVPDATATLGEGAIQPWSQAHVADYFLKLMAALGEELGFDLNTPWQDLPTKAQKSLLEGHPTKVHVVTRNRYGRQRAYYAAVRGRASLHRAPAPRGGVRHQPRAVRGLHARGAVPGLRRQPAQAGLDGGHARRPQHRRGVRAADQRDRGVPARPRPERPRAADRRAGAQGDPGAAQLPARRRPRLPLPRPAVRLAVGRRGAADPAGDPDRRRPGRRPLRARRAVDRAAPARQPPADRDPGPAQGPRQHPDRRRARRGHHPHRRLGGRHRPGRRRARRPGGAQRGRAGPARAPRLDDRSLPLRPARDPGPAPYAARAPRAASSPSRAPASTTCATST